VVVGAGLSGLACAFRLKQMGVPCLVLEAEDRPGGVIATVRRDGFLFESGPQCPRFPPSVWRLVRDLNLENEFVAGDRKAKRYIFQDGRLHLAPFSPRGLLGTRLLGVKSKFRLLTEAFGSSRPPAREESLADFVQRKFGPEVLDRLVDPFISTVFFADADKMGVQSAFPALVDWERNYGSLVRGAIAARKAKREAQGGAPVRGARSSVNGNSLHVTEALPASGSFQAGMARLPERLAEVLGEDVRYHCEVRFVQKAQQHAKGGEPGWRVGLSAGETILAARLILAVPAYVAGHFLADAAPELASELRAIDYAPVRGLSCAYNRSQVAHELEGFGFMVPRRERFSTICTFWNSSLFPQRAPEGQVLMTSFVRSAVQGDAQAVSDGQLAHHVQTENAKILGIRGAPVDRMFWSNLRALPQYSVGHAQRVAEIRDLLRALPGLHLSGNYLKGRSIGDCVDLAFQTAEDAVAMASGKTSNV